MTFVILHYVLLHIIQPSLHVPLSIAAINKNITTISLPGTPDTKQKKPFEEASNLTVPWPD